MIKDNLNPDFAKGIVIDYYFEEEQRLKFVVMDIDKPNGSIQDQDLLGTFETTLATIVTASGQALQRPLAHPNRAKAGYIKIVAEEQTNLKHVVKMTYHGRDLDKKDFFGKSDPFYQISRTQEDGSTTVVYRSKHIAKTLNPTWDPAVIPVAALCNGDLDRQLLFEVYDWNRSGGSSADVGNLLELKASANELLKAQGKEFELINPKKREKKKSYQNSGYFQVVQFYLEDVPTFLDYLAGGTTLGLDVAIDFTASNGDPRSPNSLHFRDPSRLNYYQEAIFSVGNIWLTTTCHPVQAYDTDKQFPERVINLNFEAYGFGAKFGDGTVSHCFALNGNPKSPEVYGVQGILDAYMLALSNITLYGPTNFSPIINQVAAQIRERESRLGPGSDYSVLLMITDGEITDMESTIRAIVHASNLPLSIVIVGVGNADFTKMNILDADDQPLISDGRRCERDIVQFVPYRELAGNPHRLAKEVLAEIPDQFVSYMRSRGIKPRPARAHSFASITSQDSIPNMSDAGPSDYGLAGPSRHATMPGLRNYDAGQGSGALQRLATTPANYAPPAYTTPPSGNPQNYDHKSGPSY
ncbi:hypothetical protein SpCBS45565_g03617 [Spizellomyces sp. 'palustris']|nr:hypothetical protein SpCBS45565_g03617 [Spizellomyces sp. 'palustris']